MARREAWADDGTETLVTPSIAREEEDDAKIQCMRLLAEMEAMDQESERLHAILELEQLKSMVIAMADVAGNDSARAAVSAAARATGAVRTDPVSPESVTSALSEPSSPAVPQARLPRQTALSAEDQARLDRLLAEDDGGADEDGEDDEDDDSSIGGGRDSTALLHAQTGTLRMLAGQQLAADATDQEAERDVAAEMSRMQAELRALQLQRDMLEQQMELRRLTEMLQSARASAADSTGAAISDPDLSSLDD